MTADETMRYYDISTRHCRHPGRSQIPRWLWYWLFVQASLVRTLSESHISAMHLFICFFVTDFVRKIRARTGLAKEPLIPFNVQKIGFPSSINDDFKRGCVSRERILFNSVVMVLPLRPGVPVSNPVLILYFFFFLRDFVRKTFKSEMKISVSACPKCAALRWYIHFANAIRSIFTDLVQSISNLRQTSRYASNHLFHSLIHHFETILKATKLQTTETWLLMDFKIQIT